MWMDKQIQAKIACFIGGKFLEWFSWQNNDARNPNSR